MHLPTDNLEKAGVEEKLASDKCDADVVIVQTTLDMSNYMYLLITPIFQCY